MIMILTIRLRIDAHHLAGEIAVAIMKLYAETPSVLATQHKIPQTSLTLPQCSQEANPILLNRDK